MATRHARKSSTSSEKLTNSELNLHHRTKTQKKKNEEQVWAYAARYRPISEGTARGRSRDRERVYDGKDDLTAKVLIFWSTAAVSRERWSHYKSSESPLQAVIGGGK